MNIFEIILKQDSNKWNEVDGNSQKYSWGFMEIFAEIPGKIRGNSAGRGGGIKMRSAI